MRGKESLVYTSNSCVIHRNRNRNNRLHNRLHRLHKFRMRDKDTKCERGGIFTHNAVYDRTNVLFYRANKGRAAVIRSHINGGEFPSLERRLPLHNAGSYRRRTKQENTMDSVVYSTPLLHMNTFHVSPELILRQCALHGSPQCKLPFLL
jgi:hypothetical protein